MAKRIDRYVSPRISLTDIGEPEENIYFKYSKFIKITNV